MMRAALLALLVAAAALCSAQPAAAQSATLVADRIAIEADGVLVAEGDVEVLYGDSRLTASRVRYDREGETLEIEGPLVLTEGEGTIILASSAELDSALRRGILRSARLVLDRQLQLAAAQIDRTSGRYTRLSRTVASSCEVCADGGPPLWEIRASRVIRDEIERQLYFDDAQFRIMGLPVFYMPRFRLPDPTLERSTGFLVPSIRSRTGIGTGIETPYFVTLGDHADLTFTPYLSGKTTTLGLGYRQEIRFGRLSFEGALTKDDLRPGATRGYLFGRGLFDLPRDFALSFNLALVSDDSYLSDYGITERDRLASRVQLSRVRDDQWIRAEATSFRTLRARDIGNERELPSGLIEFSAEQRLFEDPLWGQAWAGFSGSTLRRPSDAPGVGRDVDRLSASLEWNASRIVGPGFVLGAEAKITADRYGVRQDPSRPGTAERVTPAAAVSLAWPLQRDGVGGVRHLLEPTVQLAWADNRGDRVPNEDSTGIEFDESNLFSLSRFPGEDRREQGLRANIGTTWTRYDPDGWSLGITAGRVIRFDRKGQFSGDTGLSGGLSDWLLAGQIRFDDGFALLTRTLLDDNLDVARSETRLGWREERFTLGGTHLWRAADPREGRPDDLSELTLDGSYRFTEGWTALADWRLDAEEGKTTRTGLGLRYENECVAVALSLSRRLTSSSTVEPVTDIDLRISLTGFGSGSSPRAARRSCRG